MKLSSTEQRSIVTMSAIGLSGAALYQILAIWIDQSTDNAQLSDNTEALQHHPVLMNLFIQLAEFREFDSAAFQSALVQADKLVLLRYQLQHKTVTPEMADIPQSFVYFKNIQKQVLKIFDAARDLHQAKHAAHIHRLYTLMYDPLLELFTSISRLVNINM
jgi:hypothetical protein